MAVQVDILSEQICFLAKCFLKQKSALFLDFFYCFQTGLNLNTCLEHLYSCLCVQWFPDSFLVLVSKALTVNQVRLGKNHMFTAPFTVA